MTTRPATGPVALPLPDGRSLDVWLAGPPNAMPFVFHHGSPSSGLPFAPMVETLADHGLRYVSFSRAGYGSSTRREGRSVADVVDDVRAVLDHLVASEAVTLGWSGGGPHAIACAALLPDRIRGAATIGGVAPWPADGLDWFDGMGPENVEEFQASLEDPAHSVRSVEEHGPKWRVVTGADVADAFGGLIDHVDRGSLTGEFAEYVAAGAREGLRESYWGWIDDDLVFMRPWGFALDAIQVPVHIWQGGHDKMVPYGHGAWLAAHVSSAVPHLHPEHGHLTLALDSMPQILDALLAS